jgi:hypothetical protein
MPDSKVVVQGLVEAREKLEQVARDLRGDDFVDGMQEAVLAVLGTAREIVPVVTGRLKNSIVGEVTVVGDVVQGVVGSNVEYAPKVEKRRQYLKGAFDRNEAKIRQILDAKVAAIVKEKD